MLDQRGILRRVKSISVVKQMTKTMKMISISKYNFFLKTLKNVNIYFRDLCEIKEKLKINNYFKCENKVKNAKKTLIIPISSNKGFCGNFNNNIYKKTSIFLEEQQNISLIDIMPIGEKINEYIFKKKYKCLQEYVSLLKKFNIFDIFNFIKQTIHSGKYDKICVIYNHFINTSKNEPEIKTFCLNDMLNSEYDSSILFGSDKNNVYNKVNFLYIQVQILICFIESCLSEHSTRLINMSKSTDNAIILLEKLKILYNRIRQTKITNEIIEISF